MRMSGFFLPVMRDVPKDAEIDSHKLMLRAGYMRQAAAGIYSWLPLGQMVLENIKTIINEEQAAAGAVELLMPTLQPADLWRKSGRYDDYGKEMLRLKDRHDRDLLYGPTNEELITQLVGDNLQSYKELPLTLYHIQWKFRDEIRPRFGVMRGREFLMKDGYSFDLDEQSGVYSYHKMFAAYLRTFARLGLKSIPMLADTGPIGGSLSHEFIVLAQTGESEVFCHKSYLDREIPNAVGSYSKEELADVVSDWTKDYAATEDMHNGEIFDRQVSKTDQLSARGIEVGHIFFFGDKYSKPMKCQVQGADGQRVTLQSGSYGIGVSRLVGAIIESSHDDKGIVWPTSVAPFKVGLINIKTGDEDCDTHCAKLYEQLHNAGISCLYDDRNERAGSKFATMDLIGLPWQVTVGPRGVKNGEAEIVKRATGEKQSLPFDGVVEFIKAQC